MKLQNQQYNLLLWMWMVALFLSPLNHDLTRYGISQGLAWNDNGWIFIGPIIFSLFFFWSRREILMSKKNVQFILLAGIILVLTIFLAGGESWHTTQILRWVLFLLIPIFFWPICKRTPLLLAFVLLGVLTLQSEWAILQFSLQHDLHLLFLGEAHVSPLIVGVAKFTALGAKLIRAYGPYQHPNTLGGSLLIGLILALSLFSLIRKNASQLYLFFTTLFLGLALILTFSRLAAIGFIIWLVMTFILIRVKGQQRPWFMKRLAWIGLCLLILFSPLFVFRSADPQDMAIADRTTGYNWALAIEQTLHGQAVGIGNYPTYLQAYLDSHSIAYHPWDIDFVHNSIFLMMLEWGWLPATVLLLLGFYCLARFWPQTRLVELCIFLLALLPLTIFDHYLVTTSTPLILLEMVILVMGRLYSQLDWQLEKEIVL